MLAHPSHGPDLAAVVIDLDPPATLPHPCPRPAVPRPPPRRARPQLPPLPLPRTDRAPAALLYGAAALRRAVTRLVTANRASYPELRPADAEPALVLSLSKAMPPASTVSDTTASSDRSAPPAPVPAPAPAPVSVSVPVALSPAPTDPVRTHPPPPPAHSVVSLFPLPPHHGLLPAARPAPPKHVPAYVPQFAHLAVAAAVSAGLATLSAVRHLLLAR